MRKSKPSTRAKPKKRRIFISIIVLTFLLAAFYFLFASIPIFRINDVEVIGTRLLSPDEVLRTANVPIGESILLARFSPAKKRLEQIPVVKKVDFIRSFPSKIVIKIEERKEALVCVSKSKQSLILDKEGYVMNPSGESASGAGFPDITGLPVMNGFDEEWLEGGRYVRSDVGRDVLKLLSEFEGFIVPKRLQIDVSDISDIKLLVDDILKVRIGSVDKLQRKIKAFEAIYSKNKERKNDIEYIDVSSIEFPVIKFKH